MVRVFQETLHVGDTDEYSVVVHPRWLQGETLESAEVTALGSEVSVGSIATTSTTAAFFLTGVSEGEADLKLRVFTNTREDTHFLRIYVKPS